MESEQETSVSVGLWEGWGWVVWGWGTRVCGIRPLFM